MTILLASLSLRWFREDSVQLVISVEGIVDSVMKLGTEWGA